MALFSTPIPILILILSLILIFVPPSFPTPRRFLDHQTSAQTGFKVSLVHVDSAKNLTKLERIQQGMKRSKLRLQNLNSMVLSELATSPNLTAPVYSGRGEFLMNLSIGTPPLPFSAIMDTGSDLIWTQCSPCENCFSQPTPLFNPERSSSYSKLPCSSPLCQALPTSTCGNGCQYEYEYGDSSSTQGVMGTETFTFGSSSVSHIGFGCGENNNGFGEGAGLVGLGRGPLSLISQLQEPRFSYCLTSLEENKASTLLMGSLVNVPTGSEVKTTPLFKNPSMPSFYYLSLEAITVGNTRIPIKNSTFALNEDDSGEIIIDSGTTLTFLDDTTFELVKQAFISQTKLDVDDSGSGDLLCFKVPKGGRSQVEIPNLVFHFQDADLQLPTENYFFDDSNTLCLAIEASHEGLSIFGNVQQQNIMVVHDLVQETLSFVPMQCA